MENYCTEELIVEIRKRINAQINILSKDEKEYLKLILEYTIKLIK